MSYIVHVPVQERAYITEIPKPINIFVVCKKKLLKSNLLPKHIQNIIKNKILKSLNTIYSNHTMGSLTVSPRPAHTHIVTTKHLAPIKTQEAIPER